MMQGYKHGFYPVEVMVGNRWRSARLFIAAMPYVRGELATGRTEDQYWVIDIFSEEWRDVFRIDPQLREQGYRTEMRFLSRELADRYGEVVPIRCVRDYGVWAPAEPYAQGYSIEIEGRRYNDALKAKFDESLNKHHWRGVLPYRGKLQDIFRAFFLLEIPTGTFIETTIGGKDCRGFVCGVRMYRDGKRFGGPAFVFRKDNPPSWELHLMCWAELQESNVTLARTIEDTLIEKCVHNGCFEAVTKRWGKFLLNVISLPYLAVRDFGVGACCMVQISPDELAEYILSKLEHGEATLQQEIQR